MIRKKPLIVVAFFMFLYIGTGFFWPFSTHPVIVQYPQGAKDFTTAIDENWLTGWSYRKQHNIAQTLGAGVNYTVPIDVYYLGGNPWFADNGISQPMYQLNEPATVYYNDRTYVTWQGGDTTPDIFINYYNHITKSWGIAENVAPTGLTGDDHCAPLMFIDGNGYIHLVTGRHTLALKHYKSDNSEDISAWTEQANIKDAPCYVGYPKAIANGSNIHLFYSETDTDGAIISRRVLYRNSTDNGATWNAEHLIIEKHTDGLDYGAYHDAVEMASDGTIHMSWTYVKEGAGEPRYNKYYAYLELVSIEMFSITDVPLGSSITKTEADISCIVYDSESLSRETNHGVMHLDDNDYPRLMWAGNGTGSYGDYWTHQSSYWNGTDWNGPYNFADCDSAWDYADFVIYASDNVTALVITGDFSPVSKPASIGGDLDKYNWDGTDWNFVEVVLSNGTYGDYVGNPIVPVNHINEISFIFSEVDYGNFTGDLRLFAYGEDGFVTDTDAGGSVYLGEKCRSDFEDVLFTDNDRITELPYWCETNTTGVSARFWVRITDNLTESDVNIYVYYGNSGATYTGNGTETFLFFEDWTGQSVDPNKWTETRSEGSISWSFTDAKHGSVARLEGGAASGEQSYESILNLDTPSALMGRLKFENPTAAFQRMRWGFGNTTGIHSRAYIDARDAATYEFIVMDADGNVDAQTMDSSWFGDYHTFEILRNGTRDFLFADYGLIETGSEDPSELTQACFFYVRDTERDLYIDWVANRKYVDSEPIQGAWGTEEEAPIPSWHIINTAIIIFFVPVFTGALDALLIFLGLIMIPASTLYLVKGGKDEMSGNKFFYFCIAFIMGWALFLGGIFG